MCTMCTNHFVFYPLIHLYGCCTAMPGYLITVHPNHAPAPHLFSHFLTHNNPLCRSKMEDWKWIISASFLPFPIENQLPKASKLRIQLWVGLTLALVKLGILNNSCPGHHCNESGIEVKAGNPESASFPLRGKREKENTTFPSPLSRLMRLCVKCCGDCVHLGNGQQPQICV